MVSFEQALKVVRDTIQASKITPPVETVAITSVRGRVLGEDLHADRDYPPFHRSTRDGFAVNSADLPEVPAVLTVIGLARAGAPFRGRVPRRHAVEIMTG